MAAKRPRFFEKTYEGRLFAGIVTASGPYVFDIAAKRGSKLGLSTIVNHGRVQWCISEGDILTSRIPLNSLSDAARKELAYDFGLPFVGFATLSLQLSKRNHSTRLLRSRGLFVGWRRIHQDLLSSAEVMTRSIGL
jgi:hypothetical protein